MLCTQDHQKQCSHTFANTRIHYVFVSQFWPYAQKQRFLSQIRKYAAGERIKGIFLHSLKAYQLLPPWLTLAHSDPLWFYLWLTLSLSLLLIPAHSDSLWLSLDRVPVSVSEWLFGSFVLILLGNHVYFSWFNSHISKEWDGNAV